MFYFPIIVSIFSLFFVFFLIKQIRVRKVSSEESSATKFSQVIKERTTVFLKRQYRMVVIIAIPLFFVLWLVFDFKSGFAFLLGAAASAAAGFIGVTVSLQSNLKAAEAVRAGLKKSLELFFRSGSAAGFSVVGLGLLAVSIFYLLTNDLKSLLFLGLGGSLISVFARISGSVFSKVINVGMNPTDPADKTGEGILKNNAGNPTTVIAGQVGENISGCFSLAADLFETYVIILISAMVLAGALFSADSLLVLLPILLGTIAILASIIGSFFVSLGKKQNIMPALYKGLAVSVLLMAVGFYPLIKKIVSLASLPVSGNKLYLASLAGLVILIAIFMVTEYFTSKKYRPVKKIASAFQNGQTSNIVVGLTVTMQATIFSGIIIFSGIFASFWLAGIYGVALAIVAMVSLAGMVVSIHIFGLAAGNAFNLFEIPGLDKDIKRAANVLSGFGNTAKSLTNSYGIISAGLAGMILFFNFSQELIISGFESSFSFNDPKAIAGLFLGGLLCYFFIFLIMTIVNKTANEIERHCLQFSRAGGEGIGPEYTGVLGYGKWINNAAKIVLKETFIVGLILILVPVAVGFILGPLVLAGALVGSILTGLLSGIFVILGGTIWGNARKYIEEGNYGNYDNNNSSAHQAAVIGEAVVNPYKDIVGLSIGSPIKVMNIVALLIAGFLI
ncbi:MAG: sodium/proton-translocating pyrophosphatase [bacterium]|nr:sodium/proton-translocating pyrophosphatase [bacterium]